MPSTLSKLLFIAVGCLGSTASQTDATSPQPQCEALDNPYTRSNCYTRVAVSQGEPAICDHLGETLSGRENCVIEVALSRRSPRDCDRLSGDQAKTLCYRRVADLTGDYSICDTLKNADFRDACRP